MKPLACILTAAVVSFGVSGVTTNAAGVDATPLPRASQPSAVDVNRAQTLAIAELKNRVAMLKANQSQLAAGVSDALAVTGCIDGALFIAFDSNGAAMADDGTGQPVATLDPACLSDGS